LPVWKVFIHSTPVEYSATAPVWIAAAGRDLAQLPVPSPLPTPDHLHLLTQSNNMYPLAVGALFAENTIMATKQEALTLATILTIPTLLVFVLTQRFVFSGITAGAIKG
jgi:hypothetical protein